MDRTCIIFPITLTENPNMRETITTFIVLLQMVPEVYLGVPSVQVASCCTPMNKE